MIPTFIYGTAWKEERTAELTKTAVLAGFTAIDTANQKKHYREDYVGQALKELRSLGIERTSLFLQTKFTYVHGQDHRLPYNPSDDFKTQVLSSFESSLTNLHTDYIDSYILHGPHSGRGLIDADWEVWEAIEGLHQSGRTKMIGISNVGLHHLKELVENAKVKPQFVQNRCYAIQGWDQNVREYCLSHGITYQGFSLLTANQHLFNDPRLFEMAKRLNQQPQQIVFRFCKQIGILPLTGTSDKNHMLEDLATTNFELSPTDMSIIASLSIR